MKIKWHRKKNISKTEYYNGFMIDGSEFKNLSNSADEKKITIVQLVVIVKM